MLTVPVRLLGEQDRAAIRTVLDQEPIEAAQVAELVTAAGVDWWRSGARLFGYGRRGQLESLCWFGTNLIPVAAGPDAIAAFAAIGRAERRRCSSIVGPASAVLDLWSRLGGWWGPARDVRADQPLLTADSPPAPVPDPRVRLVREDELNLLLPAAVAMYTEEVGIPPAQDSDGQPYRRRVAELIRARRAYAKIVDGEVVFKADLAVLTSYTAQLQGVWVAPHRRGRGEATAGVAAVVADALRRGIPTVSLYVNEHNHAARRVYERCGFREINRFATVLF